MTTYRVIVEESEASFAHEFDGEPQINLTFENDGTVYRVTTRAHDEDAQTPTLHAKMM